MTRSSPTARTRAASARVSLTIPGPVRARLAEFAKLAGMPQSAAAAEALADYLGWRLPQLKALKKGVAEARAGKFADPAEVKAVFNKYAR